MCVSQVFAAELSDDDANNTASGSASGSASGGTLALQRGGASQDDDNDIFSKRGQASRKGSSKGVATDDKGKGKEPTNNAKGPISPAKQKKQAAEAAVRVLDKGEMTARKIIAGIAGNKYCKTQHGEMKKLNETMATLRERLLAFASGELVLAAVAAGKLIDEVPKLIFRLRELKAMAAPFLQ